MHGSWTRGGEGWGEPGMCAGSWVGGCCFLLQGPHGAGGLGQGPHSTWRVPVAGAAGVGAGEGRVSAVGWSWLLWLLSALRKSLRVHPMWGCSCSHVDVFHVPPTKRQGAEVGWMLSLLHQGWPSWASPPWALRGAGERQHLTRTAPEVRCQSPAVSGSMLQEGGFPFSSAQFWLSWSSTLGSC